MTHFFSKEALAKCQIISEADIQEAVKHGTRYEETFDGHRIVAYQFKGHVYTTELGKSNGRRYRQEQLRT
jgi:hypothetical protein